MDILMPTTAPAHVKTKPPTLFTPLTHETFDEFVRAHRFVIVHFWASWNGQDVLMQKVLETQIPMELRDQFAFGRFETDPPAHHELCLRHNVLNLPFLALYRDGLFIRAVTGMRTPEVITEYLREVL